MMEVKGVYVILHPSHDWNWSVNNKISNQIVGKAGTVFIDNREIKLKNHKEKKSRNSEKTV